MATRCPAASSASVRINVNPWFKILRKSMESTRIRTATYQKIYRLQALQIVGISFLLPRTGERPLQRRFPEKLENMSATNNLLLGLIPKKHFFPLSSGKSARLIQVVLVFCFLFS